VSTTKGELIEAIMRAVPYPQHINAIDLDSEADAIRFTWRGDRFRVSTTLFVETSDGHFLNGGNLSILMEQLIKRGMVSIWSEKKPEEVKA
jgi:hypothetical protein